MYIQPSRHAGVQEVRAAATPEPDSTPALRALAPESVARELTRRGFIAGVGATVAAGAVSACSRNHAIAPSARLTDQIEGQLNYYSWGEYENPENLDDIKRKFGFKLRVDSFDSNEEMIAKLTAARGTSGYDIVVPTGQYIPAMKAHGLLMPLDHTKIPNLINLEPRFYNPPWNPNSGYAVCKNWGTTGFMYDKSITITEPTTWADFITLAQGPARGRTSVLDDPWEVLSIALGALGVDPDTQDPAQLAQAREILLQRLAPEIKVYNSSATSIIASGGLSLVQAFNGDARRSILDESSPDRWGFVFPAPTAGLWVDNFAIAAGTQHPGAAHAFINEMLDLDLSYKEMLYTGYQTGVKGVVAKAEASGIELPELLFPPENIVARLTSPTINQSGQLRTEILDEMQARSAQ